MIEWIRLALAASAAACASILLFFITWRLCQRRKRRNFVEPTRMEGVVNGSLHHHQQPHVILNQFNLLLHQASKNSSHGHNHHAFRGGKRVLFSWADHPSMAADAVENGWSRFAFTDSKSYVPSPSKRSSLLGACAAPADHGRQSSEAEISWEVSQGSAEFMQKVRLNPSFKNNSNGSMGVASVIRAALPLPGPPLGNSAFPQEAYFEITILYARGFDDYESGAGKTGEGEKTKLLMQGNGVKSGKGNSEALVHVTSSNGHHHHHHHHNNNNNNNNKVNNVDDMKLDGKDGGKKGVSVMFSLGFSAGGSVPLRVPGSYPGSIGFNSNGSVFLDGMKLVFESEKAEWVGTDKVIGCGFDPKQKKVLFTLDSELVHVIHCQSEEFGTPLYPIMAANIDILVLVNFGQSPFKYAPANAQRTPNPCFVAPLVNSPAATLGYDDSRELFSMGRIDLQWLNRSSTKGNQNNGNNNNNNNNNNAINTYHNRAIEFDEESEADLFEIVLDGSGKSPYVTS